MKGLRGEVKYKRSGLRDSLGNLLTEQEQVKTRWKEYTEQLYTKDDNIEGTFTAIPHNKEPDVLQSEVRSAIKDIAAGKTSGADGIPIELIKELGENAIPILTDLCNKIWRQNSWPEDWKSQYICHFQRKAIPQYAQITEQSL